MPHSLTSPLKNDMGCFQFFGITNNTATSNLVHISFYTDASFKINFRHTCILYLSIIPISWNSSYSIHYIFRSLHMVDIFLIFGAACVFCDILVTLDYGIVPSEFYYIYLSRQIKIIISLRLIFY